MLSSDYFFNNIFFFSLGKKHRRGTCLVYVFAKINEKKFVVEKIIARKHSPLGDKGFTQVRCAKKALK